MFFRDLTPYEYGYEHAQSHVVNVGWLARGRSFPVGEPPEGFAAALRRLISSPVNLYRGYHTCEFCPEPPIVVDAAGRRVVDPPGDTMGNGEIRVHGADGRVYVAPVLIAHYVEVHDYLPPDEFIRAAMSADRDAHA